MKLLSLDTTADFGSIALFADNRLLEERPLHSTDGHSHKLFPQIEDLLSKHGMQLQEMDRFAAAAGPGSFTGVRVGLTAAKAFAESCGKPLCGISTLEAILSFATQADAAALLDARRGEVFVRQQQEEMVLALPTWLATQPQVSELVAFDFTPWQAALEGSALSTAKRTLAPRALAAAIGHLALTANAMDPALVDANYLRRSDAEKRWTDSGAA
jgi:tRNA threonylcarbamoyladenosine biosynthesis protein TsaB